VSRLARKEGGSIFDGNRGSGFHGNQHYNNGIVIVADEMLFSELSDGSSGISWLKGMQIVNGGQTTASIYFAKRKHSDIDLRRVRVPAKIIVMREPDKAKEDALVADISRFANSQNAVRQSDLSANKPFHVEIEKLSMRVYCPDGVGRWFYERAAGSYKTFLAREGTTPATLRKLKESIPPARRLTKTDLAKYISAWDMKPDIVSLGSQKNFDRFMLTLTSLDGSEPPPATPADYKAMIAKAKLYKDVQKHLRPMFPAFQANVTAYTVSLLAQQLGGLIDLDRIWNRQGASPELLDQTGVWAKEVNEVLHRTADGRMISEWAKKPECRAAVLSASYSAPTAGIPEVRPA
ncbi:AIPR family protein, partial [Variovorax sp. Varisp36]|uniref:AIPR family protein n=1 Tax=Variovorax sp. Varisp36 TaxID=3243031 RepID=UPI0039A4CB44